MSLSLGVGGVSTPHDWLAGSQELVLETMKAGWDSLVGLLNTGRLVGHPGGHVQDGQNF